MSDLTPERLAELRALCDAAPEPNVCADDDCVHASWRSPRLVVTLDTWDDGQLEWFSTQRDSDTAFEGSDGLVEALPERFFECLRTLALDALEEVVASTKARHEALRQRVELDRMRAAYDADRDRLRALLAEAADMIDTGRAGHRDRVRTGVACLCVACRVWAEIAAVPSPRPRPGVLDSAR